MHRPPFLLATFTAALVPFFSRARPGVPNIASHQGHGPLVASPPFVDGVLTGITLLEHETNGVASPFRP